MNYMPDNSQTLKMRILSLDFELQGVFDREFVKSWICEAAGGYPEAANDDEAIPSTINDQSNPWEHGKSNQFPQIKINGGDVKYDSKKAKLAAQNGLEGNEHVQANRDAVDQWIQAVTNGVTVWLGQNFRAHDWQFIKSHEFYVNEEGEKQRPAIIDTMELMLLLKPYARVVSLRKDYKDSEAAVETDAGQGKYQGAETESLKKVANAPAQDARNAWKRYNTSCFKESDGSIKNCLLEFNGSHIFKCFAKILDRNVPESDWMKIDWQAIQDMLGPCNESGEACDVENSKILECLFQNCTKELKNAFYTHLKKDPYACAYFVSWLSAIDRVVCKSFEKGGDKDAKPQKLGIFSPHPWIVQNHPAVLHLIRIWGSENIKNGPEQSDKNADTQGNDNGPLTKWFYQFSLQAEEKKYKLQGRAVEVPANRDGCPQFPSRELESPSSESAIKCGEKCEDALACHVKDCDYHYGIHQADVIGRILGVDALGKKESGRYFPEKAKFSPAGLYIAPTGFGKSLCYQLPAYIFARCWKALTVVISPLQALQSDQVRGMKMANPGVRVLNDEKNQGDGGRLRLTVAFYNSTVPGAERSRIRRALIGGELDVIFLAPEQLLNPGVQDMLETRDIALVALDEAHCLSAWGQSFRPEYMYVAKWLDRYCEKRLKALGIKESQGKSTDPDIGGFSRLKWTSAVSIKDPQMPFPRVALLTATLEPQQTVDLQKLFSIGDSAVVGGFASRPEINIEVYPDSLIPTEAPTKEDKSGKNKSIYKGNSIAMSKARAARRLGVLSGFLLQKFDLTSDLEKCFCDLPVLVYSPTVKQTELVFGKIAQMEKPFGLEPEYGALPYGIAHIFEGGGHLMLDLLGSEKSIKISGEGYANPDNRIPGFHNLIKNAERNIEYPSSYFPCKVTDIRAAEFTGFILGLYAEDIVYGKTLSIDESGIRIQGFTSASAPVGVQDYKLGRVAMYHGKMEADSRKDVLGAFCGSSDQESPPNIILCTNAFGMGVDKGDICSVILLGMPSSLNDLLQQAGRAKRKKEAMAATLGGEGINARAIVLTDTQADARSHRFLIEQSRIHGYEIERVWKAIQSLLGTQQGMTKNYLNSNEDKKGSQPEERIPYAGAECSPLRGILSVSLLDLRRAWATGEHKESHLDLLTNRDLKREIDDNLFNLDLWEDNMEQKLRQCFYWLERFGYIQRLRNSAKYCGYKITTELFNAESFKAQGAPEQETQAIKSDIKRLFGAKQKESGAPFSGTFLKDEKLKEWRNCGGIESARAEVRGNNRSDAVGKILNQIAGSLGQYHKEEVDASDKDVYNVLPFQSRTMRYLLHKVLVRKISQEKEPNPQYLNFRYLQDIALDVILFLERHIQAAKAQEEGGEKLESIYQEDFSTYQNGKQLFNALRGMDWIEETTTVPFLLSAGAKEAVSGDCNKLHASLNHFLGNHKSRDWDNGGDRAKTREYLALCGAALFTNEGYPYEVVSESKHVKAVKVVSKSLVSIADKISKDGVWECSFKELSNACKVSCAVKCLRSRDPLYPFDAVGLVTAFFGFLQRWYPEHIQAVEGKAIFTPAYTLRVLDKQHDYFKTGDVTWVLDHEGEKIGDSYYDKRYSTSSLNLERDLHKCAEALEPFKRDKCKTAARLQLLLSVEQAIYKQAVEVARLEGQVIWKRDRHDFNLKTKIANPLNRLMVKDKELDVKDYPAPCSPNSSSDAERMLAAQIKSAYEQLAFLEHIFIPAEDGERQELIRNYYNPLKDESSSVSVEDFLDDDIKVGDDVWLPAPSADQSTFIYDDQDFSFLQAGPGTGKTATLIWKLLWLVRVEGVDPKKIAFIAFNVAVAKVIKRKVVAVAQELGMPSLKDVFIGTCHAFMRRMLGKDDGEFTTSASNSDETVKVVCDLIDVAENRKPYKVKVVVGGETYFIGALKSPESPKVYVSGDNDADLKMHCDCSEIARKIFLNYPEDLNSGTKFPADDVARAIRAFCSEDFKNKPELGLDRSGGAIEKLTGFLNGATVSKLQYELLFDVSHLLIDEVQDIADNTQDGKTGVGLFLRKLIEMGRRDNGVLKTVVAAGDPNQGIYEYAGGSGEFLKHFKALADEPNCSQKFKTFCEYDPKKTDSE